MNPICLMGIRASNPSGPARPYSDGMPDGATTRPSTEMRLPEAGPSREPPDARRVLVEEAIVVLALSLLPSAVDALFTLFEAPVSRSVAVAVYPSVELAR